MGEHEGWVQPPGGLIPNGLLPKEAASVIRVLDLERWLKAEERTAELIVCIQPNRPSEELRNAVADYVQRLILKCFPCQVFTYGSVPLKTYLPDGDIDLTAFIKNPNLKDTWAHQVRDMLENEERNENAEFRVKEVQYIQAEVKIIKCLVENIVVDISFNQLGGLCTLCFLEEVDNLINHNHLFKRSIILIKAWCYYESRILGAHHGLISTYALETLVLYRFLEFFSKFDWNNFCVSLWGPVPISSLPDVTVEPPRKDGGELLLSKSFLEACSAVYDVFPAGQDNQGQPFLSKHFNVIDPLRINNNLGRSVSKGNFFRIRSAFAFGAKRLARLLDCPTEDLCFEVNQFFLNTWERHGSGHRPDAPRNCLSRLRLSNHYHLHKPENLGKNSSSKPSGHEAQVNVAQGVHSVPSQHDNYSLESTCKGSQVPAVSHTQSQKTSANTSSTRTTSDQSRGESTSNQNMHIDKSQKSAKPDNFITDFQGRYLFARTRSSPELAETYGEISSQGRHNKVQESGKGQASSARLDHSRWENLESDNSSNHGVSSTDDPSSVRHAVSCQSLDPSAASNRYCNDSGLGAMGEEFISVLGTPRLQQEEQDLVNVMASSTGQGLNGQVHVPMNMAPSHVSLSIPPSVLDSLGYGQRNMGGMLPTNNPFIETPWGSNMQFPQGLVSSPLTHYFPGFCSMEMNVRETDHDFWYKQERGSANGFDLDNGSFEMHKSDDLQPSSSSYNFVSSSRRGGSSNSLRVQQKFTRETRGSAREEPTDAFTYQENRGTGEYLDYRSASSRSFPTGRSKTSSENSWEGSSAKVSKPVKEMRDRKMSASEHSSTQTDDDSKEWNTLSTMGPEPERSGFPFTFYPTGPPVPFVAMLPLYNFPNETGTSGASTNQFHGEEGHDNSDSGQGFETSEGLDHSEVICTSISLRIAASVAPLEHKSDILDSDFASHWQNLQLGRLCKTLIALFFFLVILTAPFYMGWSWRPFSNNMNLLTQLMGYEPRSVPGAPLQSASNRPAGVYQHYVDEMPRYYGGTGTYLPNPKVSVRDRHTANMRKGNYNYNRNDQHGYMEGNWNNTSKHELRAERTLSLHRRDTFPLCQSQNGPIHTNSAQNGSANVAYGIYLLPSLNPGGLSSKGPTISSDIMLYPSDHNTGYGSAEHLEFGSHRAVGFVSRSGGVVEDQRFHSSSAQWPSPDQPSSPHVQSNIISKGGKNDFHC
ncbi:nucleotidyltransferase [Salix suchowensis]|nr:nucleotidyltransferase [Salix suchowensis]